MGWTNVYADISFAATANAERECRPSWLSGTYCAVCHHKKLFPKVSVSLFCIAHVAAVSATWLLQVYKGKDGNTARVAVEGLSLAIQRHECFGLLGPNGAGKTTTIKVNFLLFHSPLHSFLTWSNHNEVRGAVPHC